MAEEFGMALLMTAAGETFTLSSKAIWVQPVSLALAIAMPGEPTRR